MEEKQSLFNKISEASQKVAAPMVKLARIPAIQAIQNGLVGIMPIIIVGSIFCVLLTFATPLIGDSGKSLLPFLEPFAGKLAAFNNLTLGLLSLYAAVSIGHAYGDILKVNTLSTTLLSLSSFLLINLNEQNGSLSTSNFGAPGLFATIIVTLLGIKLYKLLIDHKVTIKLPDSVPGNVLSAFTSLIPYFVVLTICWFIRSIMNFDLTQALNSLLAPIIKGGDSQIFFSFCSIMHGFFCTVALHWDNMTSSVIETLYTMFSATNAQAFAAKETLPYIFTSGLYRITVVPAIFYPLLILMITSKRKQNRALGFACLPSALFCITEPITFGVIAFNPFFIVPVILSALVGSIITYGATALGLIAPFHAYLPWATPTFLYGLIGSGVGAVIVQLVVIVFGVIIYLPFFKAYEKDQINKELSHSETEETIE